MAQRVVTAETSKDDDGTSKDEDGGVEGILVAIRARGGRVTRPRVAIITALLEADAHVSAEDLVATVEAVDPKVHEATIYRTLAALEDLGVVYHVHLGHGPAVWHVAGGPHHHLVCARCELVLHAEPADFAPLTRQIAAKYGFALSPHFAEVGLCAACQERGGGEA